MRVALWGTFDVDNYGDHLFPLVARHELARRLPGVVVDAYAPFGSRARPTAFDVRGAVVEPLAAWADGRHDLVVVGGGEIVHTNDRLLAAVYRVAGQVLDEIAPSRYFVDGPASCPIAWNAVGIPFAIPPARLQNTPAYVAVRDPLSLERLRAAGADAGARVVPDSGLLLDRVFDAGSLDEALAGLRRSRSYPAAGRALVVQGCDLLVPHAASLARSLSPWLDTHRDVSVVVVETGRCRGDAGFGDAFAWALRRHVHRMPRTAGLADVAAAIRGSTAFVGSSLHGAITAFVYGRPFVVLNAHGESKLDGFGAVAGVSPSIVRDGGGVVPALEAPASWSRSGVPLAALQRTIDAHFDALASLAMASSVRRRRARRRVLFG